MKRFIFLICIVLIFGSSLNSQVQKPNIIFFLLDDLGWKDLGCYGGNFVETPNADQLAAEGIRFTQAYASPVCSPTRASIVSGQNAARHGIWEVIGVNDRPYARMQSPPKATELQEGILTYADVLNREGYKCGLVGKWHAGRSPQDHGFSEIDHDIHDNKLLAYAERNPQHDLGAITANSIEFLRENKNQPFFLCVSHHMVHAPLIAREDMVDKYRKKLRKTGITDVHPTYAAMVEIADESLGMLLEEISNLGLDQNTVIVLYSDNGGMTNDMYLRQPEPLATTMKPLRNQKGSLYEGGIRVPLIVRWPGKVNPGAICHEMVHSFDLYNTFIEMGGGVLPGSQEIDGLSLVPLITQEQQSLERVALYWHFPTCQWTRTPAGAIRKGKYKLIEHYLDGRMELFDMEDDIGETINLLYEAPSVAEELLNDLKIWRTSLEAQMPSPNPDYDPFREKELGEHKFLK